MRLGLAGVLVLALLGCSKPGFLRDAGLQDTSDADVVDVAVEQDAPPNDADGGGDGKTDDARSGCACEADIDRDPAGAIPVDGVDVSRVVDCYGRAPSYSCPQCDLTHTCVDTDLNCDGRTDDCDLDLIGRAFSQAADVCGEPCGACSFGSVEYLQCAHHTASRCENYRYGEYQGNSTTCPACACNADVDGSGEVDVYDVAAIDLCVGRSLSDTCSACSATGTCADADLNCDGRLDACDGDLSAAAFKGLSPCSVFCGACMATTDGGPACEMRTQDGCRAADYLGDGAGCLDP